MRQKYPRLLPSFFDMDMMERRLFNEATRCAFQRGLKSQILHDGEYYPTRKIADKIVNTRPHKSWFDENKSPSNSSGSSSNSSDDDDYDYGDSSDSGRKIKHNDCSDGSDDSDHSDNSDDSDT